MAALFLKKLLIRSGLARLLPQIRRLTQGGQDYLHYYNDRLLSAPHRELFQIAELMEMHEPDGIDLAAGVPSFDVAPSITTKMPFDRRGYPPVMGLAELREAVSHKLITEHRFRAQPHNEVLITHGASSALGLALDTFVNPGDRVVLFDPCCQLYSLSLRGRRAEIRWIASRTEDGYLRFDLDDLAQCMRRAKMIVLANPNNPTGGTFAQEDLEQITYWAQRHDVLIVHDTSFDSYHYEEKPAKLASCLHAEKRILMIGSVSKSHALAYARVGWLAGPQHLTGACALTASLQAPMVPAVSQQLALGALRLKRNVMQQIHDNFRSRRQYTHLRLQSMGLKPDWPNGAFFMWIPISHTGMTGSRFCNELRRQQKVLLWPGEFFGPGGKDHLRLSYAGDEGRLHEGLSRLAAFLGKEERSAVTGASEDEAAACEMVSV